MNVLIELLEKVYCHLGNKRTSREFQAIWEHECESDLKAYVNGTIAHGGHITAEEIQNGLRDSDPAVRRAWEKLDELVPAYMEQKRAAIERAKLTSRHEAILKMGEDTLDAL